MAHAYTPGLKVLAQTRLRKARLLPLEGDVLVQVGQKVDAHTPVAQAELPGDVYPVNVAGRLGVPPADVAGFMLKKVGDAVTRDEPIAETRPWLKFLKTVCASPAKGAIESVSQVTGQVMVRERPRKVTVAAYVAGEVAEVMPREGVVVESEAAFVQGIFGVGGECSGRLRVVAQTAEGVVKPGALDSTHENCIIVVGSLVTAELIRAARNLRVAAVVGGGMRAAELRDVLGYEVGVAVTGAETLGITVILTEGFGRIPMAARTFELFQGLDGMGASASGATQIRAGVVRPEVIVPLPAGVRRSIMDAADEESDGLREGDRVRIIRRPQFGAIGDVVELLPETVSIETEARVRVLRVETEQGRTLTVPRANVELIQT